MKILIADSGATKTDWLYVVDKETTHIQTQGLHPSTIDAISDLTDMELHLGELKPDKIYFFGTGCGNPIGDEKIRLFLRQIFPQTKLHIDSDLAGSAKAFFDKSDGAVAILGTGAICCKVENGNVVKKSASLGYAIGDEGSAADLGRRILKIYYRNQAKPETIEFIREKVEDLDYGSMTNRIYSAAKPNRELAAIAGEVLQQPMPSELIALIHEAFSDFIKKQLTTLELSTDTEIVCTGKVAHVHSEILKQLFNDFGFENVSVKYPVIASFRKRAKAGQLSF